MVHWTLLLLCTAGFGALALAMDRHQQDVFGRELPARAGRALRVLGWALLAAALWRAVAAQGWGLGLVAYSGHTSAAAGLVFAALVLWNRWRARRPAAR
ncbi:MAG: DUF3325 domain-containing protein [Pseudorhodoferax sp.]